MDRDTAPQSDVALAMAAGELVNCAMDGASGNHVNAISQLLIAAASLLVASGKDLDRAIDALTEYHAGFSAYKTLANGENVKQFKPKGAV